MAISLLSRWFFLSLIPLIPRSPGIATVGDTPSLTGHLYFLVVQSGFTTRCLFRDVSGMKRVGFATVILRLVVAYLFAYLLAYLPTTDRCSSSLGFTPLFTICEWINTKYHIPNEWWNI